MPVAGYRVIAAEVPRWLGHVKARSLSRGQPFLYIDDDVRLLAPTDIAQRYGSDSLAMPENGHMVVYRAGIHGTITHRLGIVRGGGQIAWEPLRQAAEASQCEIVDDIWLHIDKGHENETEARRRVIDLVDGHCEERPGLGDMVAAGLSAVGITKERVSSLVGGDCGCAERQQKLNALGRRIGIG